MANKNNNTMVIIAIIAIAVFAYGGSHGWFKGSFSTINNNEAAATPSPNNNFDEYQSYSVLLSFSPSPGCVGDVITGSIDSNIPNGVCSLFMKTGTDWQFLQNYNLNANGDVSDANEINTAGTALFRAICCDSSGNCKISNEVSLTINSCSNAASCTDTDGGIMYYVAGKVTTSLGSMYDTCQPNGMDLLEFYCDDLGNQASSGIGCPDGCTQSISGGYCNTPQNAPTCTDSDGGLDFTTAGNCQSSVQKLGFSDGCESSTIVKEYYCDTDFTCKYTTVGCHVGWMCIGGKCAQPRCADIINPTSQSSCDVGYCGNGDGCDFVPATLHSPAKCECVT